MATPADEGIQGARRDDQLQQVHERIARALKQIEGWGHEQCAGRVATTWGMVADANRVAEAMEDVTRFLGR